MRMFDSLMKFDRVTVLAYAAGQYADVMDMTSDAPEGVTNVLAVLAATALGRLSDARRILADSPSGCAESALGHIAKGNLDQLCGRLSDAFTEYEIGLHQALDEHLPDIVIYGRTWRNLALARFGDHAALDDLGRIAARSRTEGRKDEADRAEAFRAAGSVIVGRPISEESLQRASTFEPGMETLILASAMLSGQLADFDRFTDAVMRSEGVEGAPELIAQAIDRTGRTDLLWWVERHFKPYADFIAADDATIFPSLSDDPHMTPMDCARCDGRCCYDGVYVTEPEEERIRGFMKDHPGYFENVPEVFLEEGEWGFLFHGKRTIRVPHFYARPDFPRHFTQTKCVFALPSGECSLQKAATDNLYHPWKVKPELCWEFPLIGLFNDNAMSKPHYFGEPDPGFYDEDHPGYLSFMPCARVKPDGTSWKRMYRTEFLHYFKTKGIKR